MNEDPYFYQGGRSFLTADNRVANEKIYKEAVLYHMEPYVPEFLEQDQKRSCNEYLYALFYNYESCEFDQEVSKFFTNLQSWYPHLRENEIIKDQMQIILTSKDVKSKKFFLLALIGSELNFQIYVRANYELNLSESTLSEDEKQIFRNKRDRCLSKLRFFLDTTMTENQLQVYNVCKAFTSFLGKSIDMYEMGVCLQDRYV
jgi:hypothetical protein